MGATQRAKGVHLQVRLHSLVLLLLAGPLFALLDRFALDAVVALAGGGGVGGGGSVGVGVGVDVGVDVGGVDVGVVLALAEVSAITFRSSPSSRSTFATGPDRTRA